MKKIVIVESPGKIKKIQQYLGPEYIVKASFGHCRDLDSKSLSIDVDNNFKPNYIIIPGKNKIVRELRKLNKYAKEVILAADEDREGEMIASSIADLLKLKNPKRIVFHEITKTAIQKAIANPTTIDYNMVYAQQARRLLDRLVGYKISPILWKQMSGGKSAGRVQSVVVKIIINKEKEIEESISSSYFKTIGKFKFNDIILNSVLMKGKKQYHFKSYKKAKKKLKKINSDTVFKVVKVSNRKSIKRPSPPFITSTLQQDASTKLHFNSKRTMMAAQKLYEAGLITYMRTDSTNMSKEAINKCIEVIKKEYGDQYSNPKNFTKKSKGAQEAHECIRPTKLDHALAPEKMEPDCKKLYSLIWKRTLASQMSDAKLNIQTIEIDVLNQEESILSSKSKFVSTLETILFDGFLILYNNYTSENEAGKVDIKKDTILDMNNITVSEEYTRPPLRYNEAGLIKYLEKNGIGRPSTYSSIISKILDRKYVEIGNIDGVEKNSRIISLNNKLKLVEKEKKIKVGKENKKIKPTEMGLSVNEFLMKNFDTVFDIKFTAELENKLDLIASGKAKWFNILREYYDIFNPIVEKLSSEIKKNIQNDELLGVDNDGLEIYKGSGKYGPYVKKMVNDKWKFASVKGKNINLEEAIELLQFPKLIGKIVNANVYLHKGQYGFYLKKGKDCRSVKDKSIDEINIMLAKELFKDKNSLKTFRIRNREMNIKKGPYGYYLQIKGKKNRNISLPNSIDVDSIEEKHILEILAEKNGTI